MLAKYSALVIRPKELTVRRRMLASARCHAKSGLPVSVSAREMTMIHSKTTMIALFSAASFIALGQMAWAAGEDTTEPPAKTKTSIECKDGKVWDEGKKECADAKKSGLDDDILFKAARELAYAGQYENSLKVLDAVKDQNSARILNYRGYSNRKAGRMELGMSFYKRALQADENYILARSYMGQALMEQGKVEEAKAQLIEIRDRGGENSWAYRALLDTLGGVRQY
jgi:tetratricopeptide (TPR) repeat protein